MQPDRAAMSRLAAGQAFRILSSDRTAATRRHDGNGNWGNLDAMTSEEAAILAGRGVNARRLSQKSSSLPAIAA
jgi:hypothetical protein